ncbi:MAG: 50S rRNA methyltransferase [Prochlorococcus sp. SP3034]|nr:50S rRNA methyltransferase [Prochlorococcus sp. SP3034]|tara:strand:- start:5723 stop:6145 length:423 start_codon:yes stop_codon:yes gene_type:complete
MLITSRLSIKAIGKIKKSWINDGIKKYLKRMPDLSINELKSFDIQNFKNKSSNNVVISLSEEGENYNSHEFTTLLLNFKNQRVIFLVGDADGIPPEIKSKSDLILSLSPLTFPHELARLILIEQIYRAVSITQNSPYHRC